MQRIQNMFWNESYHHVCVEAQEYLLPKNKVDKITM